MRNWILVNFLVSVFFVSESLPAVRTIPALSKRSNFLDGFLVQRTVSLSQKSCSCPDVFSCACCQMVTILFRSVSRMLCVNFGYRETGLRMNITLGSRAIRQASIIDYRAFKVCTFLPDCRYSLACVDVMEVSQYPRSITICVQLDITSKHENWIINYNCISVSTLLSNQSSSTFPPSTTNIVLNGSTEMMGMPPTAMPQPGQMPQNTSGMLMPANGGQNIPMTPGQMPPAGQMPPPNGQMPPPGQMQRMASDDDRLIISRSVITASGAHDISSRRESRGITDVPMKVQVIYRHRKTRLPKTVGIESTEIFRASEIGRSSRIVNGNTVSIPMPNSGTGSVLGSEAATLSGNGGSVESVSSYGLSVPLPVFFLENLPVENIPMQTIAPNFLINYDNRTSSFPDRMPPGFGVYSRIGPTKNDKEKPVTPLDRSVEELETIGPEIQLHANSKIIETSTTGLGNGNIVFPE